MKTCGCEMEFFIPQIISFRIIAEIPSDFATEGTLKSDTVRSKEIFSRILWGFF